VILSDKGIVTAREAGEIVIEPFNSDNLGSDTYDVRLGRFFFREYEPGVPSFINIFDPFNIASVERVWGSPREADMSWSDGTEAIWLQPGETILAHTIEFIGGVRGYTTKMFARSSVGRSMVGVCKCAGRGDEGFFNRWTMEITSFSQYHAIPLRVGMRIAQIEFLATSGANRVYGVDKGKYQQGSNLQEIMDSWRPEMMLPRLYQDRS
jgi:dCTP deaminase